VTELPRRTATGQDEANCRWCGRSFAITPGPGRRREFCRRSCRQRAYEARAAGARAQAGPDAIVVSERALADLQDRLWVLECALRDAQTVVEDNSDAGARQVLAEVIAATADCLPLWRQDTSQ
jgi:hypothetical protein